jgi:hypothetical protein
VGIRKQKRVTPLLRQQHWGRLQQGGLGGKERKYPGDEEGKNPGHNLQGKEPDLHGPQSLVLDGGKDPVKQHWLRFGYSRKVLDSLFLKLQCQGWFGKLLKVYLVTKLTFGGQSMLLKLFMRQ